MIIQITAAAALAVTVEEEKTVCSNFNLQSVKENNKKPIAQGLMQLPLETYQKNNNRKVEKIENHNKINENLFIKNI